MKRYLRLMICFCVLVLVFLLGFGNVSAQSFTQRTGTSNYFNGVNPGWGSSVHFGDIDDDDDLDAYVIYFHDNMLFYKNDGNRITPSFSAVSGTANPLDGIRAGNIYPFPSFVDIDADGDKDLFIGCAGNGLIFYRNTGTSTYPRFTLTTGSENPFSAYSSNFWYPSFADIDSDGDFDLFTSDLDGVLYFYRNDGSSTSPVFTNVTGTANPLNGISSMPNMTFGDCDGDGDFDAVFGYNDGTLGYYRNTGTAYSPVFSSISGPVNGIDVGSNAYPTLADIDSDGDCDLFIGSQDGLVYTYINQTFSPKTVRNVGSGQPYSTVKSAVDAANEGDLINIFPGTYTEQPMYITKRIEIKGQGPGTILSRGTRTFFISAHNVIIRDLTIDEGYSNNNGGAISVASGYILTVKHCTISNCYAYWSGGGIYVHNGGFLTMLNSTIYGNRCNNAGGGIGGGGTVTIINSTIAGNSCYEGGTGAGIHVGETCTLVNSTISYNTITGGSSGSGGITVNGSLSMTNTIVSDNHKGSLLSDLGPGLAGGPVTADHCIIKENVTGISGTGNLIGVDPLLTSIDLHSNPHGTYTYEIARTSPARNAASGAPLGDQRGFPRLGAPDIGAFESQAPFAPTVQASNLSFSNISSTSIKLTWTNGNGERRIVLAKQGSAVDGTPAHGTVYSSNTAFGGGNQIGTGNYVVANTTSNTITISGLSPVTSYYFAVFEYNSAADPTYLIPGLTGNSATIGIPPVVTTQAVSEIAVTSATGNGNVTGLGTVNPTQHGVCWSTSENPTVSGSKTEGGAVSATGAFTSSMTGLSPNTTYYVKAYATNSYGTGYGAQVQFITLGMPVVTTQAVTNITGISATGNGNVTNPGNPAAIQHGICWSTTENPTIADSRTENGVPAAGAFIGSITGLSPNTTYYVRAYATNSLGTSYGGQVEFTTLLFPGITTGEVTTVTALTAIVNGSITCLGTVNPTQHGVCWNTTGNPTISDNKTTLGSVSSTGPFTSTMTGLTRNTTYYVRSYLTNTQGTGYGAQLQFTTLPNADYALRFNGTNQYATGSLAATATDNITMEAWVNWEGQTGTHGIIYNGSSGSSGYGIYLYAGASPSQSITVLCGGRGYVTSGTLLPPNTWHHIAIVRASQIWKLYLDGIEKTLTNNAVSPNAPSGNMFIGSGNSGFEYFKGSIDEVRFWTIARTQAEILSTMYTELAGTETGLAAYYRLNEGGGSVTDDNSPGSKTCSLVNSPVWINGVNIPAGSGTSGDPYQIATLNHLKWIYLDNTRWDKRYKQIADIDASVTNTWNSGQGWAPIGTEIKKFTGSYDGQGYSINSLYVNRGSVSYQGFFGQASGAAGGLIQNISLTSVNITGNENVGALAGIALSSSQIKNCYSSGNVSGYNSVGGLVGNNESSTINTSWSNCSMNGTNWSLGGLVGYNNGGAHINNCYSRGIITGTNGAGGLVGNNSGGNIDNCYSTGSVTGTGQYIGGLVGYNDYNVRNSFWDKVSSTKTTSNGGTGKTTAEMKSVSTYTSAGWSFNGLSGGTIWNAGNGRNDDYPYLQWQYPEDSPLPVELTAFIATAYNNIIELTWNTAAEVNNYGFEIERKQNTLTRSLNNTITETENIDWKVVGFVAGSGNSNTPHDYSFTDKADAYGEYTYRLKQTDNDGRFKYSEEITLQAGMRPTAFKLSNYPDPFNPETTVRLEVPELSKVEVAVYNLLGERIKILFEGDLETGIYESTFNGTGLTSGIYIIMLTTDKNVSFTKKIMMLK